MSAVTHDPWASGKHGGTATHRYYDRTFECDTAKILPGEYFVTEEPLGITTVLGSCVAACIRDTRTGAGGMNHFMLPDNEAAEPGSARYGTYAMEILINELLKRGAKRSHLEAKVFGGGNVLPGMTHSTVGQRNAEFVLRFLRTEHIHVARQDLGDIYPRKVFYFPATGKVMVKRLANTAAEALLNTEREYRKRLTVEPVSGDVELF